ncbi:glycosyltransferase 87 family protein [Streptomyces sp. NPDC005481]|uniref:glycosyltransferase 87 family protein n=1 Tax=Streptomyces sp. NPDC005481 TaxID=3154881 RepID=UPI0033AFD2B5
MTRRNVTLRALAATPAAAGTLFALSLTAFVALCVLQRAPMADALVYRAEGAAVVTGRDLYGFTVTEWRLPATYPPFAALLFVPTAWLPPLALKAAFVAGNTALLALLVRLSCRFAGLPAGTSRVCTATALALWLEPVFQTVLFGQINLALACLVLWDLSRPQGARGRGIAVGIAAGVKLTPVLFVAYLLFTRSRRPPTLPGARSRDGLTALTSFLGTVLLGAVVLPAASVDFWTRRLLETGRIGKVWIVDNQSLQGLLARALGDPAPGAAWALVAVPAACAGLRLACRATDTRLGVLATAATALLVSPVSWSHHWVWCVPLLAFLLAEGRTGLAALTTAVFTARTLWLVPHQGDLDLHLPWWQQLAASPYPLLAAALLAAAGAAAPHRTRRRTPAPVEYDAPYPLSIRAGVPAPRGTIQCGHDDTAPRVPAHRAAANDPAPGG